MYDPRFVEDNPTEAEVEDMKQNVNKIRKMDEEKGAQDSLEKELPGPEQMLSSPSPATNELKTSPLAKFEACLGQSWMWFFTT